MTEQNFTAWLADNKAELTDIIGAARAGFAGGYAVALEQIGAGGVGDVSPVRAALSSRPVQGGEQFAPVDGVAYQKGWDDCKASALSSAPAREQWQPIETAPKDRTEILGWLPDVGALVLYWGNLSDDGRWSDGMSRFYREPTHWMPLPAAPGATAEPAPAREPMTEREILDLVPTLMPIGSDFELLWFARAIERHHGITKE